MKNIEDIVELNISIILIITMKLRPLPRPKNFERTPLSGTFSSSQNLKNQQMDLIKKNSKLKNLKILKYYSEGVKSFSFSSDFNSNYLKSKRYSIFLKETQTKTMPSIPKKKNSEPLNQSYPKIEASELKSLKSQDYSRSSPDVFATSKKFKSFESKQDPETEYKSKLGTFTVFKSTEQEDFKDYFFELNSRLSTFTALKLEEELKSMKKNLPCCLAGSIFLMFKASNIGKMRALISGKPETPFADGLYLFDITIPESYPETPPLIIFRTSNNTNFCFHPEIMNNGKIVSNLLNTQPAGPDGWSNKFTLAQVLIHIQSKIMTNYISNSGNSNEKELNAKNLSYIFESRVGNIEHAMIPLILHPLPGFKEVIFAHFSLKYKEILEKIQSWINDAVYYEVNPGFSSPNPKIKSILDSGAIKLFQKLYLRVCQVFDSTFLRGHI